MTRRHVLFPCDGSRLAGTLDDAAGTTGLLIVTGGNEVRGGAWNGQALLAQRMAKAGYPVFRFDRRGVGDSDGANGGFRSAAPDIAAAIAAFKANAQHLTRIVAFGNCDAASALMLCGGTGCDALVLSNPWTIEDTDGEQGDGKAPPPAAVRAHYRQRLRDPRAFLRLLTGKVSPAKLIGSLRGALRPAPAPSSLAQAMTAGLAAFSGPVAILVAERDRTAQVFLSNWKGDDTRLHRCADATHSYVETQDWLDTQILAVLQTA